MVKEPAKPTVFEIDTRHRDWLRHLLMSGWFDRVLEVGCWKGWSTKVFLEALEAGKVKEVHLCEPKPTLELQWAIAGCKRKECVTMHKCTSLELLDRDTKYDLIFVDGNHEEANVKAELERLLPANLKCVCFHDTGSAGRIVGCEGPQFAKHAYQMQGYHLVEDTLIRPGENCERGFLVACRTPTLWKVAVDGFRKYC